MYTETMKLHLIEEVLRTEDEAILAELETILSRSVKTHNKKPISAHDFVGRWSKKDATLIEKAIKEGCEKINENDWK